MPSIQGRQNLQFLSIQNLMLHRMGINLNTVERKQLLKNSLKFSSLISCVIYLECGLINFVAHSFSNFDMATGALSIFNQGCLILVKMTTFLVNGEKFIKLIWDMNLLAEKANRIEYKDWLSENLRSQLITKIYFYACWIAVGCAGTFPLVYMTYDYHQTKKLNKKLPFGGQFPFDNGGLLSFSINYILSLIHIYALLNMTVSMDTLYGWYIYNVSAHFRILRCKVASVALKLENNNYHDFTRDIGSTVIYHNKVLKFANDLNVIFGVILWAEVLLSCLQMCFAIYTLNNDTDFSNMPFNIMVLIAVSIQLLIYCFGGEKLRNECLMLSSDIYLKFPWHYMSHPENKLMLLPLMRSQKLFILRGLFFEVDRNLLIYIVRTAISFNALLSAIKE